MRLTERKQGHSEANGKARPTGKIRLYTKPHTALEGLGKDDV